MHRDLKPDNVFITTDGQVKILDFGVAKACPLGGDDRVHETVTLTPQTEPGLIVGTVPYMSPEQVRGAPVDGRSDIFSLGAVLFEMLTGHRAFEAPSAAETMSAILTRDPLSQADAVNVGSSVPPPLIHNVHRPLNRVLRFMTSLRGARLQCPASSENDPRGEGPDR